MCVEVALCCKLETPQARAHANIQSRKLLQKVHKHAPTPQDLAREWGVDAGQATRQLPSPHPALQLLLEADAAATVYVLGAAVEGWDAVETELLAAAGKDVPEALERVSVATQVLADALAAALPRLRALEQATESRASIDAQGTRMVEEDEGVGGLLDSPSPVTAILDCIVGLLLAGRVTAPRGLAPSLLAHARAPPRGSRLLAMSGNQAAGQGSTGAAVGSTGAVQPGIMVRDGHFAEQSQLSQFMPMSQLGGGLLQPLLPHDARDAWRALVGRDPLTSNDPREALVMRLLEVVGVNRLDARRPDPDRLSVAESDAALAICGFSPQQASNSHAAPAGHLPLLPRAAAALLAARGQMEEALAMYLSLTPPPSTSIPATAPSLPSSCRSDPDGSQLPPVLSPPSPADAAAPFAFLHRLLTSPAAPPLLPAHPTWAVGDATPRTRAALLTHAPALAARDPAATAALLLAHFPSDQEAALEAVAHVCGAVGPGMGQRSTVRHVRAASGADSTAGGGGGTAGGGTEAVHCLVYFQLLAGLLHITDALAAVRVRCLLYCRQCAVHSHLVQSTDDDATAGIGGMSFMCCCVAVVCDLPAVARLSLHHLAITAINLDGIRVVLQIRTFAANILQESL